MVDAICIPLLCNGGQDYWNEVEETELVILMQSILRHPMANVTGQNWIYDSQYIKRWFGFFPDLGWDTMLAQHVLFPGTPKDLAYLSSLYDPYHVYWKEDHKEATKTEEKAGDDLLWAYNAKDCTSTYAVAVGQSGLAEKLGLADQHSFLHAVHWLCLRMSYRGIAVDKKFKTHAQEALGAAILEREAWLAEILGHPLNVGSPKQMKELFYGDFAQKEIRSRKTGNVSTDDESLVRLAQREPLLAPLVGRIRKLELSESLRAPLLTHHSPSMDALEAALIREVRKHFDSLRQQAHFGKG